MMKTPTDYFDLAVKNTFVKTSRISCSLSSPSFISSNDELQNYDESNDGTVELFSRLNPDERSREVSYHPKVLEEWENLRKMNINVSYIVLVLFFQYVNNQLDNNL